MPVIRLCLIFLLTIVSFLQKKRRSGLGPTSRGRFRTHVVGNRRAKRGVGSGSGESYGRFCGGVASTFWRRPGNNLVTAGTLEYRAAGGNCPITYFDPALH